MKNFALLTAVATGLFTFAAAADNSTLSYDRYAVNSASTYLPAFDEAPAGGVVLSAVATTPEAAIETSSGFENKKDMAQAAQKNYSDTHGIVHTD